jgi:glycosyltransferase 2 family protein
MKGNLRKMIIKLMRIAISLGLIIWLFSRFDLSGVWHAFERLPVSLWIAAFCILLIAQILSSLRWWIISKALQFQGAWSTYLGFYFVGMFFNLFLPTGIGGDIFKIHFLSRGISRKFAATLTILGDRFFGLASMVLIGAVFLGVQPGLLPTPFVTGMIVSGSAILLALAGMPLILRALKRIDFSILRAVPSSITQLLKPKTLFPILGLSLCLQALGMGAVALMGRGMEIHVSLAFYFVALPIINIMAMVPITFNGIGVREGAFVYLFGLKGIEPELAMALGLLFFSIQVATGLIGGVAYAFGLHRRSIHEQQTPNCGSKNHAQP